jgi:acetyl-CoA acetyltransferase
VLSTIVSNGDGRGGRAKTATKVFDTDEGPRADTSLDALARLKPPSMPVGPSLRETVRR